MIKHFIVTFFLRGSHYIYGCVCLYVCICMCVCENVCVGVCVYVRFPLESTESLHLKIYPKFMNDY